MLGAPDLLISYSSSVRLIRCLLGTYETGPITCYKPGPFICPQHAGRRSLEETRLEVYTEKVAQMHNRLQESTTIIGPPGRFGVTAGKMSADAVEKLHFIKVGVPKFQDRTTVPRSGLLQPTILRDAADHGRRQALG